jgi:hypothetical protein
LLTLFELQMLFMRMMTLGLKDYVALLYIEQLPLYE